MSVIPTTTLVIACGAIAHELVVILKANQLSHIEIQCLPAEWHNTPQRIVPAIEQKIIEQRTRFDKILVAYGDCGTGGKLDELLSRYDIERLPGDHCYSFFAGRQTFEQMADDELGTFYLTDYLADNFQRLILDGLGISKHPELLEQYFGNYTRVMYLRQITGDEKSTRRLHCAQAAAASLNLPLVIHYTGLAPFEQAFRTININVAH